MSEKPDSERKTLLIVDDSAVIREIASRIAVDLGLNAAQAENAADAVEAVRERAPDAVLLDWDLPAMGALDFLRAAAELEENPTIILCATENDPQQFTLARAAGARCHTLKPFDRDSLHASFIEAGLLTGPAKTSESEAAAG